MTAASKALFYKQLKYVPIPFIFFAIGHYFDQQEVYRMSGLKDKTALYRREVAPGESPTW
ncbi:NADH dehydrogenase [ubiquinone] 1 beta subcomplex subunit 1 [Orussus abietinus]|uniref:NADH dehydrogenase [ubiquinone] 1 beta subcomplex subunit 1 n=1 Tax=Orussus abietinus TaxID=222816 RepID=UPI000625FE9F|nr:NADH dehydrogenase [ubiquinone] 1 beta subcomplex subunit 1 [Orussus abietinus]